jgi:hypothetical protein
LKWIELLFLGDGERMRVTFKNSEGIELKLFPELGPEVFSPLRIKHAIIGNYIAYNKNTIINSQDNGAYIVDRHGYIKRDERIFD